MVFSEIIHIARGTCEGNTTMPQNEQQAAAATLVRTRTPEETEQLISRFDATRAAILRGRILAPDITASLRELREERSSLAPPK